MFAGNAAAGLATVCAPKAWLDRTDEAEHFVVEQMQRLRSRLGPRYEKLIQCRAVVTGKHGPERLVIEALRLRPLRAEADSEWWLVVWNVDRIAVRFQRYPTREALRSAIQTGV
ncbi:MAG: hypothetical protein U1A78_34865 [Polyangia bacterium]